MWFFNHINSLCDHDYGQKFITYMIAPVITGIKPSSTITLRNCNRQLYDYWKYHCDDILSKYNLNFIVLKEEENSIVALVYDESNLISHLRLEDNYRLLEEYGYSVSLELKKALDCLYRRVQEESFPHETGVFLGIPCEDVVGFINEDRAIYDGYWKVFKDLERYDCIFNLYQESKEIYIDSLILGRELDLKNIFLASKESLYDYCA